MNEQYKLWIDECSKLFGGMDILGIFFKKKILLYT